jgi:hypothetical protein
MEQSDAENQHFPQGGKSGEVPERRVCVWTRMMHAFQFLLPPSVRRIVMWDSLVSEFVKGL